MGAAMAIIKAPFLMHSVIFLRLQKMTRPVGIA